MRNAIDMDFVRSQFPGLSNGWVLMDNAGGTQILQTGIDRIAEYLRNSFVQLGGSYDTSVTAERRVDEGRIAAQLLVNAQFPEEIIFGPSATVSVANLAQAMRRQFVPGDEIILTQGDHESNIGAWERLQEFGVIIRFWPINKSTKTLDIADLEPLLNEKVKLVCVHHVSNILGQINPIREIAERVHQVGARICVDGVAYAPHRAVDVQEMDVDFYVLSLYKVYGPHCSVLYGKRDCLLQLDPIYHYFYTRDVLPGKMEPGDPNYELSSSVPAITDYLIELGRRHGAMGSPRDLLVAGFDAVRQQEDLLVDSLLAFLAGRDDCIIVGTTLNHNSQRLPIVAFKVDEVESDQVCRDMDRRGIAIRYGMFHANRLVEGLGMDDRKGVVRISLAHYNTADEVTAMIDGLKEVLDAARHPADKGVAVA